MIITQEHLFEHNAKQIIDRVLNDSKHDTDFKRKSCITDFLFAHPEIVGQYFLELCHNDFDLLSEYDDSEIIFDCDNEPAGDE